MLEVSHKREINLCFVNSLRFYNLPLIKTNVILIQKLVSEMVHYSRKTLIYIFILVIQHSVVVNFLLKTKKMGSYGMASQTLGDM